MRDAFAKTAEKRNAATTALPAPGDQPAKGPIPYEVHHKALENARAKERADLEAQWKQYEWAKTVPQQTLQKAIEFATLMGDDPVEFADKFVKDLVQNPQYKEALLSRATRNRDAQGRYVSGQTTPQIDLNPYRVQMSDGKEIGLYTAEQMAAREAMLESAVDGEGRSAALDPSRRWPRRNRPNVKPRSITPKGNAWGSPSLRPPVSGLGWSPKRRRSRSRRKWSGFLRIPATRAMWSSPSTKRITELWDRSC